MKNMLTASLALIVVLLAAGNVAAKSSKEVSPYPLGERSTFSDRAIAERIKPVGAVCVAGEECGSGEAADTAAAPMSPEELYNSKCAACHNSGMLGAPRPGVATDWAPRLARGKASIYSNAINGINSMPAKGGCVTCSDDEIKAAIDFMLDK